jgi:membrane protein
MAEESRETQGSLKDRLMARVNQLRRDRPSVDHTLRMQEHYGSSSASQQAGAVTYFGFLSFFPIMALAFFLVGYVAKVYPDAQDTLRDAINQMLPGIIGTRDNQIRLKDIQDAAGAVGLIGLAGVLYSGLGWLSALRDALMTVFEQPAREQPSFVMGKIRDLLTLAVLGVVLLFSVGFTGLVSGFSGDVLDFLGLGEELSWLVQIFVIVLGLAANSLLFVAMFRLLAAPDLPMRAMWSGALLGAVGFELLKQLSGFLIRSTQGQPAFQVFGLALILLVWINYFSRVILYAASWAWTDPLARAQRVAEPAAPVQGPQLPAIETEGAATHHSRVGPFVAGAALGAAATAAVVKGKSDDS